jgi:hypothetical protein
LCDLLKNVINPLKPTKLLVVGCISQNMDDIHISDETLMFMYKNKILCGVEEEKI